MIFISIIVCEVTDSELGALLHNTKVGLRPGYGGRRAITKVPGESALLFCCWWVVSFLHYRTVVIGAPFWLVSGLTYTQLVPP